MSSGFVSGGTTDNPTERDDEWLKAQQEIEANRRAKEEMSRHNDGKSLYEVLQANKAAKQEAFEESIRLKNQFRSLDEDEVDFLDSILESTRAKEEAVKKETSEQLELFRQQQVAVDQANLGSGTATIGVDVTAAAAAAGEGADAGQSEESRWTLNARKRKRAKEKEILKGVRLRKSSSSTGQDNDKKGPGLDLSQHEEVMTGPSASERVQEMHKLATSKPDSQAPASGRQPASLSLGVGTYDSEDD